MIKRSLRRRIVRQNVASRGDSDVIPDTDKKAMSLVNNHAEHHLKVLAVCEAKPFELFDGLVSTNLSKDILFETHGPT